MEKRMADAWIGLTIADDALAALTEIMGLLGPNITAREALMRSLGTELYLLKHARAGDEIVLVCASGDGHMETIDLFP
jgi:hypothetical protein